MARSEAPAWRKPSCLLQAGGNSYPHPPTVTASVADSTRIWLVPFQEWSGLRDGLSISPGGRCSSSFSRALRKIGTSWRLRTPERSKKDVEGSVAEDDGHGRRRPNRARRGHKRTPQGTPISPLLTTGRWPTDHAARHRAEVVPLSQGSLRPVVVTVSRWGRSSRRRGRLPIGKGPDERSDIAAAPCTSGAD